MNGTERWTRQFGARFDDVTAGVAISAAGVYGAGAEQKWEYNSWGPTSSKPFVARLEDGTAGLSSSRPVILWDCVLNAASLKGGGIAPDEIITILGQQIGPRDAVTAYASVGTQLPSQLASTRVLINGTPGPVLYASNTRVNAIVPYGITAPQRDSVQVEVEYQGVRSEPLEVLLLDARPGFFRSPQSPPDPYALLSRALVFNEDGSMNTPDNPARRGSVITTYLTGEGLVNPVLPDGTILGDVLPRPVQRITVQFGDEQEVSPVRGDVVYAGSIKGAAPGVLQLNIRVPTEAVLAYPSTWMSVLIGSEHASTIVALR